MATLRKSQDAAKEREAGEEVWPACRINGYKGSSCCMFYLGHRVKENAEIPYSPADHSNLRPCRSNGLLLLDFLVVKQSNPKGYIVQAWEVCGLS